MDENGYAADDGLVEHILRRNPRLTREKIIAELEEWGASVVPAAISPRHAARRTLDCRKADPITRQLVA